MAARRKLDQQPGSRPDIQITSDNVVFSFALPDAPEGVRFIVRCDAHGEIWASIESSPPPNLFTAGD